MTSIGQGSRRVPGEAAGVVAIPVAFADSGFRRLDPMFDNS
jgi:hypothetical protein